MYDYVCLYVCICVHVCECMCVVSDIQPRASHVQGPCSLKSHLSVPQPDFLFSISFLKSFLIPSGSDNSSPILKITKSGAEVKVQL